LSEEFFCAHEAEYVTGEKSITISAEHEYHRIKSSIKNLRFQGQIRRDEQGIENARHRRDISIKILMVGPKQTEIFEDLCAGKRIILK